MHLEYLIMMCWLKWSFWPLSADCRMFGYIYACFSHSHLIVQLARTSGIFMQVHHFALCPVWQEATTKLVVGLTALFAGNLIARGQILEFWSFVVFFFIVGIFQWPMAGKSAAVLLVCYFLTSLKNDGVSVEWAVSLLKFLRALEIACSSFMFPCTWVTKHPKACRKPEIESGMISWHV